MPHSKLMLRCVSQAVVTLTAGPDLVPNRVAGADLVTVTAIGAGGVYVGYTNATSASNYHKRLLQYEDDSFPVPEGQELYLFGTSGQTVVVCQFKEVAG